ncbi:MAG: hypothetical protein K5799_10455 [Erythrobacter sp.]|nr:hypothetical protein [Erythrobacter sp.]
MTSNVRDRAASNIDHHSRDPFYVRVGGLLLPVSQAVAHEWLAIPLKNRAILVDFLFLDLAIGMEGKHLPNAPRRAVKQFDYAHADHITGVCHQVRKTGQFVEHIGRWQLALARIVRVFADPAERVGLAL